MKKIIFVNLSAIVTIVSMMLIVSCGGGGGSTSSGGGTTSGTTVQGFVTQFNGVAMVSPNRAQSMLARALTSVSDRVLPTADALEGVTVIIGGLTTTTDSSGSFSVEGVPPGPTEVTFIFGDVTVTTIIDIPPNAEEVYLNDVRVVDNKVVINGINFELDDDRSIDDNVSSADGTSSDDDQSRDDDKSSDDDSSAAKTT
jgi:hypothetical protein